MLSRAHLSFFFFASLFFIILVLSTFNRGLNSVSLYIIVPVLSLYSIIRYRGEIIKFKPLIILYLLFVWILLSGLVADDLNLYLATIKTLLGVVLLSTILYCFSIKDVKYIHLFYLLYCIKFIYIFIYAINNDLLTTNISSTRFNLEELNANSFGYYAFFAISSSYLLLLHAKSKKIRSIIWILVFLCLSTGLIAVIIAASRAGFLIITSSVLIMSIIYLLSPFRWKSIFFVIVISGLISLSINNLRPILEDTYLFSRFGQIESDSRLELLKDGLEVWLDNPIMGVGAGNLNQYVSRGTHSSYSELLGSNGIVGFLLFVFLLAEPLKKSYTLMVNKELSPKLVLFYVAFFIIYIFYNFFYWFYMNMFLLGYFILIRTQYELLSRSAESGSKCPKVNSI